MHRIDPRCTCPLGEHRNLPGYQVVPDGIFGIVIVDKPFVIRLSGGVGRCSFLGGFRHNCIFCLQLVVILYQNERKKVPKVASDKEIVV